MEWWRGAACRAAALHMAGQQAWAAVWYNWPRATGPSHSGARVARPQPCERQAALAALWPGRVHFAQVQQVVCQAGAQAHMAHGRVAQWVLAAAIADTYKWPAS